MAKEEDEALVVIENTRSLPKEKEMIRNEKDDRLEQTLLHKKIETLRIPPKIELHRSSSGRNLRLKHVALGRKASAPHELTPRAPSRKLSLTNQSSHEDYLESDNQFQMDRENSPTKISTWYTFANATPNQPEVEDRKSMTYEFDLWKKARKNMVLPGAIVQEVVRGSQTFPKLASASIASREILSDPTRNPAINDCSSLIKRLSISDTHMSNQNSEDHVEERKEKTVGLRQSKSPRIQAHRIWADEKNIVDSTSTIKWKRGELIGEGTFGKVYMALNVSTGELFALKEIEIRSNADSNQMKQLQKLEEEICLMKNLSHKHIVSYKGSYRADTYFYIFMEYVPGGSIASMLEQFDSFCEDLIRKFTLQIVQGVAYLHSMGIIHRDIKGANVLVTEQGVLKLADFGCSKQLPQIKTTSLEESLRSIRGSVPWMAPEVVKQTGHGFKADIWSIGATVIEMATAKHPWPDSTNNLSAMYAIAMTKSSPPIPTHLSGEAVSFLKRCFCIDPKDRATAEELLQHPFLQERETHENRCTNY